MKVLLLDDNLMFSMRVESQIRRGGHDVRTLSRLDSLAPEDKFDLILLNLGSRSLRGLELVPELQTRFAGAKIWGFAGHKETEIWRAAKAAGVEKMVTNEVAMSELDLDLTR